MHEAKPAAVQVISPHHRVLRLVAHGQKLAEPTFHTPSPLAFWAKEGLALNVSFDALAEGGTTSFADETPPKARTHNYRLLPLAEDDAKTLIQCWAQIGNSALALLNAETDLKVLLSDPHLEGFERIELCICREPKGAVRPARASAEGMLTLGIDDKNRPTATDTGEVAKGAKAYNSYVSNYLAEIQDAVSVFRDPNVQNVDIGWLLKVSQLESYSDGPSLRFAREIAIGRQLGYFSPDLVDRLQQYRKGVEKIIGHPLSIPVDGETPPTVVPGHDVRANAESLSIAIGKAVDFYNGLTPAQQQLAGKGFTAKTATDLEAIAKQLDTHPSSLDEVKGEAFAAFSQLDQLESTLTRGPNAVADRKPSLPWADALTPGLKLERLQDPSFKPVLLGETLDRGPTFDQFSDVAYSHAVETNIPGVLLGYNDKASFDRALTTLNQGFSQKSATERAGYINQLYAAGELAQKNSDVVGKIYDTDQQGFLFGYGSQTDGNEASVEQIQTTRDGYTFNALTLNQGIDSPQQNAVRNAYHELTHLIDRAAFTDDGVAGTFKLQLTPDRSVSWIAGVDERLAAGTRFLGDNPFTPAGKVPPIGWISENTFNQLSGDPTRLYYPWRESHAEGVATNAFHIAGGNITDQLKSVALPETATHFSNLHDVYTYLNQIQQTLQNTRILKRALNDPELNQRLSREDRSNIQTAVRQSDKFIQGDLDKVVEATALAQYARIRADAATLKGQPEGEVLEHILARELNAGAAVAQQFDDRNLAQRFGNQLKDEIVEQYSDLAASAYGIKDFGPKAEALLNRADFSGLLPTDPQDLSSLDNPSGVVDQGVDTAAVKVYRQFAEALGVDPKSLDTSTGSAFDYESAFSTLQPTESGKPLAEHVAAAAEKAVEQLLVEGGDANVLAGFLADYLRGAGPEAEAVFRSASGPLAVLDKIESVGSKRVSIKPETRAELGRYLTGTLRETEVANFDPVGNRIDYYNAKGEKIDVPRFAAAEQPYGYKRIRLTDGRQLFEPDGSSSSKATSFVVDGKVFDRIGWLRSHQAIATPEQIETSITYYRSFFGGSAGGRILQGLLLDKLGQLTDVADTNPLTPGLDQAYGAFFDSTGSYLDSLPKNSQTYRNFDAALKRGFGDQTDLVIDSALKSSPDSVPGLLKLFPQQGREAIVQRSVSQLKEFTALREASLNELARVTGHPELLKLTSEQADSFLQNFYTGNLSEEDAQTFATQLKLHNLAETQQQRVRQSLQRVAETAAGIGEAQVTNLTPDQLGQLIAVKKIPTDEIAFSKALTVAGKASAQSSLTLVDQLDDRAFSSISDYIEAHILDDNAGPLRTLLEDSGALGKFSLDHQFDLLANTDFKAGSSSDTGFNELLKAAANSEYGLDGLATLPKEQLVKVISTSLDAGITGGQSADELARGVARSLAGVESLRDRFTSQREFDAFAKNWAEAVLDSSKEAGALQVQYARGFDDKQVAQLHKYLGSGESLDKSVGEQFTSTFPKRGPAYTDSLALASGSVGTDSTDLARQAVVAKRLATRLENGLVKLQEENGLDKNWAPVLSSIKEDPEGGFELQLVNTSADDKSVDLKEVHTQETSFIEARDYLDSHSKAAVEALSAKDTKTGTNNPVDEVEGINGLNAAFAAQALIGFFQQKKLGGETQNTVLADVLQAHEYLNLARVGYGLALDGYQAARLVKTIATSSEAVAEGVSASSRALSVAGQSIAGGADVVLSLASAGFDIYELTQAQTGREKAVIGTQLAFDSGSAVIGGVSIGLGIAAAAGVTGAAAAGAVLGGAGAIFAGIGIGIAALVDVYSQVAKGADYVGDFFADIDDTYKNGGFTYDAKKDVLATIGNGIVTNLDFRNSQVDFGTHKIYRTHHGGSGSGKDNIIWWGGNFPQEDHAEKDALSIREKIGYGPTAKLDSQKENAKVVVVPVTPDTSTLGYEYNTLPGATTRHDRGFDVVRRLENDKKFDYDFYAFPSEYTIDKINYEYKRTGVSVTLDKKDRVLVIPKIPDVYQGKVYHNFYGDGGHYTIALNDHAEIYTHTAPGTHSVWVVDDTNVSNKNIWVHGGSLHVGNASIGFTDNATSTVLVNDVHGDLYRPDFQHQKLVAAIINGETLTSDKTKSTGNARPDLVSYLEQLGDHGKLDAFTQIKNYHADGKVIHNAAYSKTLSQIVYGEGLSDDAHVLQVIPPEHQSGENLVVNGNFEDFDGQSVLGHAKGWQTLRGDEVYVFGHPDVYGKGTDGDNKLDVAGGTEVFQTIKTEPGKVYNLSFDQAALAGRGHIEVLWNGQPLDDLKLTSDPYSRTNDWHHHTYSVTATGAESTLSFKSFDGSYLDDVKLTAVDHGSALFYDPDTNKIARVDNEAHSTLADYPIPTTDASKLIGAQMKNGTLLVRVEETRAGNHKVDYTFSWQNNHFVLNRIDGDAALYDTLKGDANGNILDRIADRFDAPLGVADYVEVAETGKTPLYIDAKTGWALHPKLGDGLSHLNLVDNTGQDSGVVVSTPSVYLSDKVYFSDHPSYSFDDAQKVIDGHGLEGSIGFNVNQLNFSGGAGGHTLQQLLGKSAVAKEGGSKTDVNTIHEIEGRIYLEKGDHELKISHDDGLKFTLGGQTLINRPFWDSEKPTTVSFHADQSGYYKLNALYYQDGGGAYLQAQVDGKYISPSDFAGPLGNTSDGSDFTRNLLNNADIDNLDTFDQRKNTQTGWALSSNTLLDEIGADNLPDDIKKLTKEAYAVQNLQTETGQTYVLHFDIPPAFGKGTTTIKWNNQVVGTVHADGEPTDDNDNWSSVNIQVKANDTFATLLIEGDLTHEIHNDYFSRNADVFQAHLAKVFSGNNFQLYKGTLADYEKTVADAGGKAVSDSHADASRVFFDPDSHSLYRQQGNDAAEKITLPNTQSIDSVTPLGGSYLVQGTDGLNWLVNKQGQGQLVGIRGNWLEAQTDWPDALQKLFADGVPATDKKAQAAQASIAQLLGGISSAPIPIEGLHAGFLNGTVYFVDRNPANLANAESLIHGKTGTDYRVKSLDFHEDYREHYRDQSLAHFLGDNAVLADADAGKHVHNNAIHTIDGKIWLSKGDHTFSFVNDDGFRFTLNGTDLFKSDVYDPTAHSAKFTADHDGYYSVNILYFEGNGDSNLKVQLDGNTLNAADDTGQYAAWYDPASKQVIVSNVDGKRDGLQLLNVDQKQHVAWIYDATDKHIYRQSLLSQDKLDALFADGSALSPNAAGDELAPATALLEGQSVVSITRQGSAIDWVTDQHQTYELADGNVRLTGAPIDFIRHGDFKRLPGGVQTASILRVNSTDKNSSDNTSAQWYVPATDNTFTLTGLHTDSNVQLLGADKTNHQLFASVEQADTTELYKLTAATDGNAGVARAVGSFEQIRQLTDASHQSTLLLQGIAGQSVDLPVIDGVNNLYVTASSDAGSVSLGPQVLNNYQQVVVDDSGDQTGTTKPLQIQLTQALDDRNTYIHLDDGNLVFTDRHSQHSLVLQQASTNAGKYQLEDGPDLSVSVTHLIDTLKDAGASDSLPLDRFLLDEHLKQSKDTALSAKGTDASADHAASNLVQAMASFSSNKGDLDESAPHRDDKNNGDITVDPNAS